MEFPDWVQVKEKTPQMANKSVPRNHLSDVHKWTTIHVLRKQLSICTYTVVRPGFHYTANATTTTQKQSDYKVEQSSFTLIALF